MRTQVVGWVTDLLETGAQRKACQPSCWAVLGGTRKAHLGAPCYKLQDVMEASDKEDPKVDT